MPRRNIPLRLAPIICLALCLTAIARQVNAQDRPIYTTAFDSDEHGTIYLPVTLNSTLPARFFFDTGSLTFLSDVFVSKNHLQTHPVLRADGKPAQFENGVDAMATTVTIAIPHTPLTFQREVLVLTSGVIQRMGVVCDGILGADSLANMAVQMDLIGHRLSFLPGGNVDAATRGRLGMNSEGGEDAGTPIQVNNTLLWEVPVSYGDGVDVPMLIDSGSEFTKIPADVARRLKVHWQDGARISVATGEFAVHIAQADSMRLGALLVHGQRLVYTDAPSGPVANPLGRDFLRRTLTLIDLPARKLYVRDLHLEPGPNPFTRRLVGEQSLIPPHTLYFPYGGQSGEGASTQHYEPRASVLVIPGVPLSAYKVVQNQPPPNAARTPVEIDIQVNQGAIIVPATIQGEPARMLLDLGSIATWLTPNSVARLKLKTRQLAADGSQFIVAEVNPLQLAPSAPEFASGYLEAYVGEKPDLYRLTSTGIGGADGVLGLDYLAAQVIGLDLKRHKLLLWPWASDENDWTNWLTHESHARAHQTITLDMEHVQDDWFYVEALINGQRVKMALDTADPTGCTLPDIFRIVDAAPAQAQRPVMKATLEFEGFTLPAVPVTYVSGPGLQAIPRLGLSRLAAHRLILDLPRHRMLINQP